MEEVAQWLGFAASGGALFLASAYEAMKTEEGSSTGKTARKKLDNKLAQDKFLEQSKANGKDVKDSDGFTEPLVLCPPLTAVSYQELQKALNKIHIQSKFQSVISEDAGVTLQGLVVDLRFLLPNYPSFVDERALNELLVEEGLVLAAGESLLLRQPKYEYEENRKTALRPGFFFISSPYVLNSNIVTTIVRRFSNVIAKKNRKPSVITTTVTKDSSEVTNENSSSAEQVTTPVTTTDDSTDTTAPRKRQKTEK